MPTPAIVHIGGRHVRDKNWGPVVEAIEKSAEGQTPTWFDDHRMVLTWEKVTPTIPPNNFDEISKQLLDLHNQQRQQQGRSPLQLDTVLTKLAVDHSAFMARTGNFAHDEPGNPFNNRMRNSGLLYRTAAENIALSYPTPAAVVTGWMGSPGHRANIMNPNLNRVGFGLVKSASGRFYWTADFTQSVSASVFASMAPSAIFYSKPGGLINPNSATELVADDT